MDLTQARTLLQRINRVFDDFGEGDAGPSALERDLLKEYVRRFYESLSDETAANYRNGGRPKRQTTEPEAAAATHPSKRDKTRRPLSGRTLRESKPRPSVTFAPTPEPAIAKSPTPVAPAPPAPVVAKPAPAIIHVPDSVEADVRKIESTAPAHPTTENPTKPTATARQPTPELEPALRELFSRERGTDLGDRLGNAPVADLTRAMSIGQRLVVQDQLFAKDAAALRDALVELNNKDGYEEATRSLVTTARKYDWTEDERRGVARDFVKLVQRRYAKPT